MTSLTGRNDTSTPKHIVIIGGGIAGITCADTYAYLRPTDTITILSNTSLVKSIQNVNRVSNVLEEFTVEQVHSSTLYKDRKNTHITICNVTLINSLQKVVYANISNDTNSNTLQIKYDILIICSGARPNLITNSIQSEDDDIEKYIFGIRDTETVRDLHHRLLDSKRVVIVGNGGIALELVHEIRSCQLIWVIKDKHVGNAFFDQDASSFLFTLNHNNQNNNNNNNNNESNDINNNKCQHNHHENMDNGPAIYDRSNLLNNEGDLLSGSSSIGPQWYNKYKFIGSLNASKINQQESRDNLTIEYSTTIKSILTRKQYFNMHPNNNEEKEWNVYIELSNGKWYGCDFIISATGVVTNNKLDIQPTPPQSDENGYLVDENMETTIKDIYAAGDVASIHWKSISPLWFQMKLWSQARIMGRFAAQCIVKRIEDSDVICTNMEFEIFAHVTRFFNLKVVMLGRYNIELLKKEMDGRGEIFDVNQVTTYTRIKEKEEYIKVILYNGRLKGALLIGETDLEETFENLMLNQIDLSHYGSDLLNPDIDIEDYFD